jgi:hypothetical protein
LVNIFYPKFNIYTLYKDENGKEEIQKIVEELFEKTNEEEHGEIVESILHLLWDYLCEADTLQKADLIFVRGN